MYLSSFLTLNAQVLPILCLRLSVSASGQLPSVHRGRLFTAMGDTQTLPPRLRLGSVGIMHSQSLWSQYYGFSSVDYMIMISQGY
ncbi:uncharacterized protein B0H18DRAFT_1001938, partial [Fomitopsis serialis]|uniref:uncharacterized protein n=1 Tax=Fomitopsis serialis TaxID=139415 RepID=UPI0020076D71